MFVIGDSDRAVNVGHGQFKLVLDYTVEPGPLLRTPW